MEKIIAQETQYARSLIEASPDPLFTISLAGKITDLNNASVIITGLSRENLVGSDLFDYFTEPQKAREVCLDVFEKTSVVNRLLTIRHKQGKLTDVSFNASVYKDHSGEVLGAVMVARDVTDQKIIAAELTEAKVFAELASEIAEAAKNKAEEATKAAEDATRIAEVAMNAKQQFLSNMSHEIRTPMNAIIGFTKVLLKTEMTDKQMEYLSAIKDSGEALTVLINDILDLAKVDSGKMTFEQIPFKMETSLAAMLHLFEIKILEKNLELIRIYDKNIPEVLIGDPVRLHQIVLNLVSNAVKFTSAGKITVGVKILDEDHEHVNIEFAISDTGIGISEDKIETVFEVFQQASSGTSRLYGGTGLGLAIVKQLVEPQGGTVSVRSKVNEGTTFSVVLPFKKTLEKAIADDNVKEACAETENIRVLVVEDIPLNQLLMKTILNEYGFENDVASNGRIAIEKLKGNVYDIILMDLQMPEMNGFETTEYIRNKLNSKIPIIALTADVTTVDLAKCRSVGMNDYLSKPVDDKLLYSKIIEFVKRPAVEKDKEPGENVYTQGGTLKFVDLSNLSRRTKSDPKLMMEMITLYLNQTPSLIAAMKEGLQDKDYSKLQSAVHKMVPSFSMMGISKDFENIAKKVQEDVDNIQRHKHGMPELVSQLEKVCTEACKELEAAFKAIKEANA
ncbi:MAG: sensor hybrid histidine kinase [Bacteroidetes bacterium]|nr:sensor hybrid histidine kinase [Bacteroidota bacterium]